MAGLRGADESLPAGTDPGSKIRAARIRRTIAGIQIDLQEEGIAAGRRRALLRRLDAAEYEWHDLLVRVRKSLPAPAADSSGRPPDLAAIRRLAGPAAAVLEFMVGESASAAFLVTSDGLDAALLPPRAVLAPLVDKYLSILSLDGEPDHSVRAGGARLGALLLGPFRKRLSGGLRSLVIVPDGPLHYLPFETLIDPDRSTRFLVQDFDVRYGPSAAALLQLADRPAPAFYARDFLGLANSAPMRRYALSADEVRDFPALRGADREIEEAGRRFAGRRSTLLLGRRAEEAALKALPLAEYRIIHLAAHGFFDDRRWWRSSLVLLPDKKKADDGFLQPDDISGLSLGPELLVLSGCETGLGRLQNGEGLNGLAYSFFCAGARSILLSLWDVDDRATAVFMNSFYDHWLGGRTRSEALRQTKIDMLGSAYADPRYWAGFVLLGN